MSAVMRYEWGDDGMWEWQEQGRYIQASDYDALSRSHAALVEALGKLLSASYEDGDTLIAARNDARAALCLARGEGEV